MKKPVHFQQSPVLEIYELYHTDLVVRTYGTYSNAGRSKKYQWDYLGPIQQSEDS